MVGVRVRLEIKDLIGVKVENGLMGMEDKERKTRMDRGGIINKRRRQSRSITHLVICMVPFVGLFSIFFSLTAVFGSWFWIHSQKKFTWRWRGT